jgi:NAD(P)-dependent dehydrogenase (short-subunit alcohol dehydrogenase family)
MRKIRFLVDQNRNPAHAENVTSVAGKLSSSPLGAYSASKFALEALSEALAQEVRPFGLHVAIVEPGIIDTPMARAFDSQPGSRYRQGKYMAALFKASLENPTPASVVATVIRSVVENSEDKLRHPAGPDAEPLLRWRAAMTDEDWTTLNALNPEEYRKRIKNDFGLELKLSTEDSNVDARAAIIE